MKRLHDPMEPSFELSPIKAIELAASKIPNAISLAQGIPSFETPDVIRDFVIDRIREGRCDKYSLTIGLQELREEIALGLASEGLFYDAENEILITAGSIEGITAAVLACTSPGDEVLVPSPSYASYRGAIGLARCHYRPVALDEDHNFDFHIGSMEKAISSRTRAILYCAPNNPTGTPFSEEKTRAIVELAERHNLIIIVDEVYKDFYYSEISHFSPAQIPSARKRIVRVCSFSKAFSMTGWRIGFVHSDQSIISQLVKFHDAMVTCAPVVSQYGALAALRFGSPFIAWCREEFRKRRDYTVRRLEALTKYLDFQVPQAAYFVFPRLKDTVPKARDSKAFCYDLLAKAHLALVPGIAFGPTGEAHVRITFGRDPAVLQEGLDRFSQYLIDAQQPKSQLATSQQPSRTTDSSATTSEKRPFEIKPAFDLKRLAGKGLSVAARIFLRRNAPTTICIVGVAGKTIMKRAVGSLLEGLTATRVGALSYNTELGLPLAVLGLNALTAKEKPYSFALAVAKNALLMRDPSKFLVLEMGISNTSDAKTLLQTITPDWLILTSFGEQESVEKNSAILEGMRLVAQAVASERILWPDGEPWVSEISPTLLQGNAFGSNTIPESMQRPTLTRHGQAGLAAAILLGRKLEFSESDILLSLSKTNLV